MGKPLGGLGFMFIVGPLLKVRSDHRVTKEMGQECRAD